MQKDFYVHYWEVYEIEPMKYKEEFDAVSSLFSYEDIKDCKFIQDDEKIQYDISIFMTIM